VLSYLNDFLRLLDVFHAGLQVVMKLVPDRKKFMKVISGPGNVSADMEQFCTTFPPFLEENHKFLVRCFCNLIAWSVIPNIFITS